MAVVGAPPNWNTPVDALGAAAVLLPKLKTPGAAGVLAPPPKLENDEAFDTGSAAVGAGADPKVLAPCPNAKVASVDLGAELAAAPNWKAPDGAGAFEDAAPVKEKLLAGVDWSGLALAPKAKVELGAFVCGAAAAPNVNKFAPAVVVGAVGAPNTLAVVVAGAEGAPNTLDAVVVGAPKVNVDDLVSGLPAPKVKVFEGATAAVVVGAGAPPKVFA